MQILKDQIFKLIIKNINPKGVMKMKNLTITCFLIFIVSLSNAENKKKYKYLLTEKGLDEKITITKKFIKIKKAEYEKMQKELEKYESSKRNNII